MNARKRAQKPRQKPRPWLKRRREELGYSQEKLSQLAGISYRTVRRAELGENDLQGGTAELLASALGESPDWARYGPSGHGRKDVPSRIDFVELSEKMAELLGVDELSAETRAVLEALWKVHYSRPER